MSDTNIGTVGSPNTQEQAFSNRAQRAIDKKLPVMEVFGPTIQGEGHLCGIQTHFIRFGLCDYKCTKCDSIHAISPEFVNEHTEWLTQEEIAKEVFAKLTAHTQWMTLSGGNPAIHDLTHLCEHLHGAGFQLAIETQGTFAPDWIAHLDCITVSPKSPGMGEKFEPIKFRKFLEKYQYYTQSNGLNVKVVIFSAQDLEFAAQLNAEFIHPYGLSDRFYLSLGNPNVPTIVDGELYTGHEGGTRSMSTIDRHRLNLLDSYRILVEEVTSDKRLGNARFTPQLHVLAYGNEPSR